MTLGRGGVVAVAKLAGISRQVVQRERREIAGGPIDARVGVRRPGAGRKRVEEKDRKLLEDLESLVSPETRGDPESPLRWTCKSLRELSGRMSRSP